jgi:hypothetical protein
MRSYVVGAPKIIGAVLIAVTLARLDGGLMLAALHWWWLW